MGDMNAKVKEATNEVEEKIIGKHTLKGDRSPEDLKAPVKENRDRLLEYCVDNGLRLANTMFNKPVAKLATYRTPSPYLGPMKVCTFYTERANPF